jgi:hypothetical protein
MGDFEAHLRQLRDAIRRRAKSVDAHAHRETLDVQAPRNIVVASNVGSPGSLRFVSNRQRIRVRSNQVTTRTETDERDAEADSGGR